MCNCNPLIHYCVILSDAQLDFLFDRKSPIDRQRCLHRLMTAAVRAKTILRIKGVEITLEVGQVAASDVELAHFMGCNRKTIGKLMDSFGRLGMLTTRTNNRTSVHTLHFLTGWYVGDVLMTNPHYVRPSASAQRLTVTERTPQADGTPPMDGRRAAADGDPPVGQCVDSTEAGVLPSLSSSDAHSRQRHGLFPEHGADHTHNTGSGTRPSANNDKEASCSAQDAGKGSEADPVFDQGC
ncbi:hypothetical protein [Bacteroides caecigallinarum]|uniref:hypothetical protein n=1 Tax=Bacteroides caecigallinarum TaxID=1411144 RepID=UPI00374D5DE6